MDIGEWYDILDTIFPSLDECRRYNDQRGIVFLARMTYYRTNTQDRLASTSLTRNDEILVMVKTHDASLDDFLLLLIRMNPRQIILAYIKKSFYFLADRSCFRIIERLERLLCLLCKFFAEEILIRINTCNFFDRITDRIAAINRETFRTKTHFHKVLDHHT